MYVTVNHIDICLIRHCHWQCDSQLDTYLPHYVYIRISMGGRFVFSVHWSQLAAIHIQPKIFTNLVCHQKHELRRKLPRSLRPRIQAKELLVAMRSHLLVPNSQPVSHPLVALTIFTVTRWKL